MIYVEYRLVGGLPIHQYAEQQKALYLNAIPDAIQLTIVRKTGSGQYFFKGDVITINKSDDEKKTIKVRIEFLKNNCIN